MLRFARARAKQIERNGTERKKPEEKRNGTEQKREFFWTPTVFVRILIFHVYTCEYVIVIACLRGQYRIYCTRPEGVARGQCAIISVLPE